GDQLLGEPGRGVGGRGEEGGQVGPGHGRQRPAQGQQLLVPGAAPDGRGGGCVDGSGDGGPPRTGSWTRDGAGGTAGARAARVLVEQLRADLGGEERGGAGGGGGGGDPRPRESA